VTDTAPTVAQLYRKLLLERSGAERLKMGCAMFDSARAMMRASLSATEPPATTADLRVQLFLRTYSRDLDPLTVARVVKSLGDRQPDRDPHGE
jgi:hypothetical protein